MTRRMKRMVLLMAVIRIRRMRMRMM